MLAGLLYLGSGVGLILISLHNAKALVGSLRKLPASELGPFLGAVLLGGVAGPFLLMAGLRRTPGSVASLLLNMEGPFTVLLATLLFGEMYGRRLVFGFILILGGSVALSFSGGDFGGLPSAALLIVAACLCWGFDNNLSKKVVSLDARAFAAAKGLIAGSTNLLIAITTGERLPSAAIIADSMLVGFVGYGLSLVFFILALRRVGAARTSAYFSTAPFVGAIISLLALHEPFRPILILAAAMMGVGVYLHLTEQTAQQGAS